jgi:transposase
LPGNVWVNFLTSTVIGPGFKQVISTAGFTTPPQFFDALQQYVSRNYYSNRTAFQGAGPKSQFLASDPNGGKERYFYLTLVYQIDLGVTRLLWVGKERTIESFQGFFTVIGDELASKIAFVCSDMWEPYLKVIREKCSEARHILDRFHIVAKMNKALDEVRAEESRRMASEGLAPALKKSRWLLLKREENLKVEQRFRLRDLPRLNLKTVRAFLLKESFQQPWDYNSPAWVGEFLDEWCRQVMRSCIEPMKKIARSMREHRDLILNYFRAQKLLSSGVVEGLNNKAKVTMRKILWLSYLPLP